MVENTELKLMKHELIEIHKTLDKVTKEEVDLMKHLIADTSMRAAFVADESAILNGFQKLNTFVNELQNVTCSDADDCLRKRMSVGGTHLPHFDISQNMEHIYRRALNNNTSTFTETLIEHINRTYKCDIPKIVKFADGIVRLAFKEQQVTTVYNILNGSDTRITDTVKDWMNRMYKLEDHTKNIIGQCLMEIKTFMLQDIEPPKYQGGYPSNSDAVSAIKHDLEQKYSWLEWIVMAFDTNNDTAYQTINIDGELWAFPSIQTGHRNIIANFLDKGTYRKQERKNVAAELKYILANSVDDVVFEMPCNSNTRQFVRNPTKSLFKGIISEMKGRGVLKYIKSFTLLNKEKNWAYAKDNHHTTCFLDQTFSFTDDYNNSLSFHLFAVLESKEERMFLKSDEERTSLIKCSMPCPNGNDQCIHCHHGGQCNHYTYSSGFFCDCKHFFHGEQCEIPSNITTALNMEELFQQTATIPKLSNMRFDLKDLSGFLGTSLGNIEAAVDHLESSVDRAFLQLRISFPKQFRWRGLITGYGEHVKNLQKFIELLEAGRYPDGTTDNDKVLHDLAEAVLGAQRYHGIRKWLHDINKMINGTTGLTITTEEPFLISFMNQFKNRSCTEEYKNAIDNVWRQLMILQLRGYVVLVHVLHILNEPIDPAVKQYKDYSTSQTETLKASTCSITIPGSKNVNCSGGFYLNKNSNLKVVCEPNYYLLGNANVNCGNSNTACKFCNCSIQGSSSQECDDQTGKCSCRGTNYGNKCENRDCTLSSCGAWSACPCGYADQTRSRRIVESAVGSGTCHGGSLETRSCFQGCCSGQFHCSRSRKCVPETKHCDNRQDCAHNEDESDCCETKYTPWQDNGGGDTKYLDRHNLDCGSQTKMMTRFRLEASPYPGNKIRYVYTCCRVATSFCRARLVNNNPTEENENLIYLDKQRVDCGSSSIMNAFRLVRNNHGQWYYNYRCCDFYWTTRHICTTKYSPWTTEGSGKNFFLDRQDVHCVQSYLSYFHLERNWPGHTSIRYNYRCCAVS